jgi:glycosyltransferase involved in cell wall biosynthesis
MLCEGQILSERQILSEEQRPGCFQAEAGYRIRCFESPNTHPSLKLSPQLEEYLETHLSSEDLVILNGIFHLSIYAMSRCLRRLKVAYVVAPHDPYHPAIFSSKPYLKWPYWYLIERVVLQGAKAVQVLDRRHGEWLHRRGIATPTISVPNGFSQADVQPEEALNWINDRSPQFCFLGRLDAYNKGLDLLLNAFAEVAQVSDATLTIQGPDWGDRPQLQQQTHRLGLDDRVTFLPANYQSAPSALIAIHDVFCLASRFEGFSLAALEAMLAGRVLLVSDIAGIAPHVQASGCGVVVNPEIATLKAGMLDLLARRSEWQEMGLRGRRYALEFLQWNKIAAEALQHYQSLPPSPDSLIAKPTVGLARSSSFNSP